MLHRHILQCIILIFAPPVLLLSQTTAPTLKNVTLPSPNAASLGKYGEIPVGNYTGIPQVSVPLHTITAGDLQLPVSISYHAAGIKLEEIPSSVGTGWTLNIGGAITRSIRGNADKYTGSNHYQTMATMGALYGFSNTYRAPIDAGNCDFADINTALDIANGVIDGQPDIYYFNFAGYSGSFFLSPSGNFLVSPKQALSITYSNNTTTQDVEQWIITASDGVKYYFGKSETGGRMGVEINNNGSGITPVTSWQLMDIVHPQGDRIKFTYTTNTYTYDTRGGEAMNVQLVASSSPAKPLDQYEKKYITNTMSEPRISQVDFPNGKIEVASVYDRSDLPGCPRIDTIRIFNSENASRAFKKIVFEYANSSFMGNRLTLMSVQELSTFSTPNGNKHTFTYDNSGTLPVLNVHLTGINSQDLWGFYNGVVNTVFPPTYVINHNGTNITMSGATRYANAPTTKIGVLTSIQYPTGGKTEFEYEGNTVYSNLNYDGVPLVPDSKSATTNYGVGGSAYVDFTIANAENGIAKVQVMSHSQTSGCPLDPYTGVSACNTSWIQGINGTVFGPKYLPEGSSSLELPNGNYRLGGTGNNIAGQPITNSFYLSAQWYEYPQLSGPSAINKAIGGLRILRIKNSDGNNHVLSVKKYLYNQFSDPSKSSGVLVNFPAPYVKQWFSIGFYGPTSYARELWAQVKSDPIVPLIPSGNSVIGYENVTVLEGENGENGKTEYTYSTSKDSRDGLSYYRPYPPPQSTEYRRGKIKKEVIYKNSGGSFLPVQSVDYLYSDFNKIEKGIGVVAENQVISVSGNGTYQTTRLDVYVSSSEVNSELSYLSQKTTRQYVDFDPAIYHEQIETYQYDTTQGHYQLIKTITKNSKGEELISESKYPQDLSLAGSAETARASLVSKHIWNPVLQQTTYNSGTLSTQTNTNYNVLSSGLVLPQNIETKVGTSPLEKRVEFLKYDITGNILQQQKSKDVINFIIWDYNSAYPIAQVVNASDTKIDSMAYTSFEADGKGNWTFSGVPIVDITAPTGRKCYYFGSSNITKANLSTTTTYIVSYWKKNGTVSVNGTSASTGRSVRGWTYYEHQVVNPAGGLITISGSGALIDELRLYPKDASMTTYTYKPHIGISSECDANNRITYYEYDLFNRLYLIRDQDFNILKRTHYNYGSTENTALVFNDPQVGTYVSNCGTACMIPSATSYTVPANIYLAPDKSMANQLALEDVLANGQTYANALATCSTPGTTSILGSNSNTVSFTVQFQNVNNNCTPLTYSFVVNAGVSGVNLGSIKEGNYNVTFSAGTSPNGYTYRVNGLSIHSIGGTIYDVAIRSSASNQVMITP